MTRGNEVGFSGIFTSSAAVEYANCERQPASDVMEITKIKNMEPGEVVRFFKEHLKWLVVNPAFNLVDGYSKSRTFNLEVKAVQRMFETPNDTNKLGVYSDPVVYEELTQGQPGGFGYQWPA